MKKTTKLISLLALCGVCSAALTSCQNDTDVNDASIKEVYTYENPYEHQQPADLQKQQLYVMDETVAIENEDDLSSFDFIEDKTSSCHQVKNGQVVNDGALSTKDVAQVSPCVDKNGVILSDCSNIQPVESMNIETPARCQIPKMGGLISSVPLGKDAFKMSRLDKSDALPRFEVNGYTFKNKPLDVAIQDLLSEAGIKVFSDDGLFPEISGDKIRGELSSVLDELTAAGDVYYRYNAQKKQLILSRWGRFVLSVPGGRIGMYTVLDALRGADITNIQPDFGTNEIYMRVNKEKFNTVKKLTDKIMSSSNLVMFDVQVYRLIKKDTTCMVDWQKMVEDFGVLRVNASVNGIVGRVLTMKNQPKNYTLLDSLKKYGSVNLISEGVAVMPDGWKVVFDIGQCTKFETPEQQLSMVFQSNIVKKNRIESNISLNNDAGEITSFHTMYGIGDTLDVIGIPGKVFNPAWDNGIEYVIVLTPRLVRLVK